MADDAALAERVAGYLAALHEPEQNPAPKRKRIDRSALPVYEHQRFRCPECKGVKFKSDKMRSKRREDGTSEQIKECECGHVFVLKVK